MPTGSINEAADVVDTGGLTLKQGTEIELEGLRCLIVYVEYDNYYLSPLGGRNDLFNFQRDTLLAYAKRIERSRAHDLIPA